jgi:aldose 1-epimerase
MNIRTKSLACVVAAATFAGCGGPPAATKETKSPMTKQDWGKSANGLVELYTLTNAKGMEARIMTYGAIVVSLTAPDRDGKYEDIVLGFDSLDGYLKTHPYFGSVVGRYGNRIAKGKFTLNGKEYTLATNNGPNALHGGLKGFDKQNWTAKDLSQGTVPSLELTYVSKDGEEGYPGTLTAKVTYTLTDNNELKLDYSATTDKDTVQNITNHSYFNLMGQSADGDVLNHEITINANRFTPVDSTLIPKGQLVSVEGTPFDLREATRVGLRIDDPHEQLKFGGGYDHNFVLNGEKHILSPAARVTEPKSGRVMEVLTTQPGVQFYTGNFLDGTITGKGGKVYKKRYGLCLETQHFPDSPNKPQFPSTVVRPGETFHSSTVYRFSAQ